MARCGSCFGMWRLPRAATDVPAERPESPPQRRLQPLPPLIYDDVPYEFDYGTALADFEQRAYPRVTWCVSTAAEFPWLRSPASESTHDTQSDVLGITPPAASHESLLLCLTPTNLPPTPSSSPAAAVFSPQSLSPTTRLLLRSSSGDDLSVFPRQTKTVMLVDTESDSPASALAAEPPTVLRPHRRSHAVATVGMLLDVESDDDNCERNSGSELPQQHGPFEFSSADTWFIVAPQVAPIRGHRTDLLTSIVEEGRRKRSRWARRALPADSVDGVVVYTIRRDSMAPEDHRALSNALSAIEADLESSFDARTLLQLQQAALRRIIS